MMGLSKSIKKFFPSLILLILLLGIVFLAKDWNQVQDVLAQASLKPIPFALGTTLISYLCISSSFALVNKLLRIRIRARELIGIGFVSTVLNHIVSSGGAAGYSVRYALMNRHGIKMRQVLTVSILHFYLTSILMITMLPVGLLFLLTHATISGATATLLTILAVIVLLMAAIASSLIFWGSIRGKLIRFIDKVTSSLFHLNARPVLEHFDATLVEALQGMRESPITILYTMLLITVDWMSSAATLWFCFSALGLQITPGELITGFVIGIMAGVASMIPGGLGVQEGSMAGVFGLLGVPFDRAVLASILFRLTYFFIPYMVSLGFYWKLLHNRSDSREVFESEVGHAHPDA